MSFWSKTKCSRCERTVAVSNGLCGVCKAQWQLESQLEEELRRSKELENPFTISPLVVSSTITTVAPRMDAPFISDRAPDLIEPVLAWRGWEVTPTGHLTSAGVSGGIWDPGVNRAVCVNAGHTEDVPAVNCACGFYGWHEPKDIAHGAIRGAIKCWGEIIVHDTGIRSEYAEILCLFDNKAHGVWLKRAADRYEVPIVNSQADAEEFAAKHGIRVPESMRPRNPKWGWGPPPFPPIQPIAGAPTIELEE